MSNGLTLGKYLNEMRESKSLSLRDLKELSGISIAEISRIENGIRKEPGIGTLITICDGLGIDEHEALEILIAEVRKKRKNKKTGSA
jgi:transcriptional regulator with XRE-family HTH domain